MRVCRLEGWHIIWYNIHAVTTVCCESVNIAMLHCCTDKQSDTLMPLPIILLDTCSLMEEKVDQMMDIFTKRQVERADTAQQYKRYTLLG